MGSLVVGTERDGGGGNIIDGIAGKGGHTVFVNVVLSAFRIGVVGARVSADRAIVSLVVPLLQ